MTWTLEVGLFEDIAITFDSSLADPPIPPVGPTASPSSGKFAPMQSLAAFDGLDANGEWSLEFFDDYACEQADA